MENEVQDAKKNENNKKADEIIELKKQIESQKVQIDETEDRLKRVAAEFDNYKKRNTNAHYTLCCVFVKHKIASGKVFGVLGAA